MRLEGESFAVDGSWPTLSTGHPIAFELGPAAEDFQVDEVDAYPACGSGEHLLVRIQKRGVSTTDVVRRLAGTLGIGEREIGFAGRKDARGLATQRFSVPRRVEPRIHSVEDEALQVLELGAHRNKIRLGHLAGNSFKIRLMPDRSGAPDELQRRVASVGEQGIPNYFGAQRFGPDFSSAAQGLGLLLRGRGRSGRRRDGFLISAAQSLLFNDYIARRIEESTFARALPGDLLKTERGGLFRCEDPALDSTRIAAGELRITGPMFGRKMMTPNDTSLTLESEILSRRGLEAAIFSSFRPPIPGTRRPIRVDVADLRTVELPPWLEICFTLPAGSFATIALRELFRS